MSQSSRLAFLAVALTLTGVVPLRAQQDAAQIEALAPLLMAQDRRAYDSVLFTHAIANPDRLVRRTAALAIGRIGDHQGTRLVLSLLADRDSTIAGDAFFALGLLRDSIAVEPIIARLRLPDSLAADAVAEAATALAKIGGAPAARFVGDVLASGGELPYKRRAQFIPNALLDAWRFGALAPVQAMLRYVTDTSVALRWNSVFSLGRVRAPTSGQRILSALRDADASVRAVAAKSLTRRFVDTIMGPALPARSVENELARAFDDVQAPVRVNALVAAATFADSMLASKAATDLSDDDPNVQVAAASALGDLRGSIAVKDLNAVFDRRDANSWPVKRAALLALAHADTAVFARRAALWLKSVDFRERIAAIEGWAIAAPAGPGVFRTALDDPDPRVQAPALDAWHTAHPQGDTALMAMARRRLSDPDPWVRAAAADALRESATLDDLDAYAAAWRQSLPDRTSDARLALLRALGALAQRQPGLLERLADPGRQLVLQRPADPVVRADAEKSWPALAARWGGKWPIETDRTLEDYRSVVRRYVLADSNPHVTIEVQGRGNIDIELFAHEAPLTVANFLMLVDRHYFDGSRFHRVVPNFVIQDGDPTGTGNGGPGWSIRDEINRERYGLPVLGMALDGSDTGGSQWFINLSEQPHLDGVYTVFGQIPTMFATLPKIIQGDVIRSIHR